MDKIGKNTKILLTITLVFYGCFYFTGAFAVVGDTKNFYIDPAYDFKEREESNAISVAESSKLYFYVDRSWWEAFSNEVKNEIKNKLLILGDEFDKKIYPTLTSNFGSEWSPGIDGDEKVTVLIHPMKKGAGGYFYSGNEYSKFQISTSNEREMIYMNSDYILSDWAKGFLAHEFVHLITFNQKERILGMQEEVWLNEARAEYAITLCGYNSDYQGSNLQRRVVDFLRFPSTSITKWESATSNYSVLNVFFHYLVDHYGVKILNDSLRYGKTGVESINYALDKNGFEEDLNQIFTDWTVAVFLNDCSLGEKYCYKDTNLKSLKVIPEAVFLPVDTGSVLFMDYIAKDWTGYWLKILGGQGKLVLEFNGDQGVGREIPYVLCDKSNKCELAFLSLDENYDGKIEAQDFANGYSHLSIIPSMNESGNSHSVKFSLSIKTENGSVGDKTIQELLAKIESLKNQIAAVQAEIKKRQEGVASCGSFDIDLYFGADFAFEITCLQEFLKNQGQEIYPEGLVTGNFLSLTRAAVVRFQEKHAKDILNPLGLQKGTGYAGALTRAKINQILSSY